MFIDKQEFEELPYLERNRNWLSLFSGFNTASAIIEFFTTSTYAVIFFTSANISKNWILSFVLSSVLSICSVVIIAWIVSSQRLALRKLFGSFETKPKFDDITYFIAVIAITAILVIAFGAFQL